MNKILSGAALLAAAFSLAACGAGPAADNAAGKDGAIPGLEDGVFTVGMEAAYAPYNWAQPDKSNDAVPIKDSALYANGYDVMTAKEIAKANGWKLEIKQLEWDSLIPAVQSGEIDAAIAGQSMTKEREETVDFAGPYLYARIVVLTKADSKFANAKGLADLAGGRTTSQTGTVWYDTLIPQIKGAQRQAPAESAPAMLVALETGKVDYVVTDMPTGQGAMVAYPDMKILDFPDDGDDFQVSDEDINIGVSIKKGNTALKDAINKALSGKTAKDFDAMMADAVKIQPQED
ncbi:transporter substrate-binding domain-containing protein [uncultured Mobiluncus sp.]|uniref:transporter substrate-binding domain-containing protein n=1 Tax=uncultured Mobiluncus sp. TaxID=293425 RepID=UPI0026270158|nr:transporter substrate-binding domain-containing protein [uncultured Mobiluncus sp.]